MYLQYVIGHEKQILAITGIREGILKWWAKFYIKGYFSRNIRKWDIFNKYLK